MKRSRIFLGLTTGALAIAGAVAAKATHFGSQRAYYITAGAAKTCIFVTSPCNRVANAPDVCKTDLGGASYYTQRTSSVTPNKCVSLLHYTTI